MTTDLTPTTRRSGRGLARVLGVASLGLGLVQLLRTEEFAEEIGLDGDDSTLAAVRAVGARELAVVPGLLLSSSPGGWLAARVAGDAVDLALLRRALDGAKGSDRELLLTATGAVLGLTALDLLGTLRAGRRGTSLHLTAAVTVNCPPEEVYRRWRRLEDLPRFMTHLESVRETGARRSHWTASAPVGSVEWDAEVVQDEPGRRLAWRSVGKAAVPNSGEVRFEPAPGDRGTEVRVELRYALPAGKVGAAFARLLGEDPHQQVEDDLRRFKSVVETGEVARSAGSPGGTDARRQRVQHPGHPVGSR